MTLHGRIHAYRHLMGGREGRVEVSLVDIVTEYGGAGGGKGILLRKR